MQDLWQEVSCHQSIYSKLWSFGVRSLRSRECGLYEASYLLLGDHLCGKSQTIKWVDVSQPHNRKRRLRDHSKLVEIQQRNPNSTNIFEDNLVDTFYPDRPDEMEDVASMTLLPTMSSAGLTNMAKQSIVNSTRVLSQITNYLTLKRRTKRRAISTPCFCSLFPFATKMS